MYEIPFKSYSGVTSCWVSGDVDLVELLLVAAGDVETITLDQ